MKNLFLILLLLAFLQVQSVYAFHENSCPQETPKTLKIIDNFFSLDSSMQVRIVHGLQNLNQNDVFLLIDEQYDMICESLFENHEQGIMEEYLSDGGKKWDVAFYKGGDFFFVIYAHKQPVDSQQVAIGSSAIIIYDDSLNRIGAYSF